MSGTDSTQDIKTGGPRIVLVEPQLGENIGAAARAMLNCGLTDMALVTPRDPWPNPRAVAMSSGATEVLDNATLHDNLADAVGDLQRVYATTARPREMIQRAVTASEATIEIRAAIARGEATGIMFGPERSGFTNDHLTHADTIITVPLNPAYASLNLAQAVLLVGYELSREDFEAPGDSPLIEDLPTPATKAELEAFLTRLEAELDSRNYFRTEGIKPSMLRSLRTIFQRAGLSNPEVRTLHGVVSTLITGWSGTPKDEKDRNG